MLELFLLQAAPALPLRALRFSLASPRNETYTYCAWCADCSFRACRPYPPLPPTTRGWGSFLAWKRLFIAAKSLGLKLPWLCFYRPLVPRAWRRASLGHTCSRSRATPATATNGPLESCCNRLSLTSSGSRSGWSGRRECRGK